MIYFLHNPITDQVKIGSTIDLKTRKKTHEREHGTPLSLLGVAHGSVKEEKQLHAMFQKKLVEGECEWFVKDEELIAFLSSYAEQHPHDGSSESDRVLVNLRLPIELREQLAKLAERNLTDVSVEIVAACLDRLKANQLWPPPSES